MQNGDLKNINPDLNLLSNADIRMSFFIVTFKVCAYCTNLSKARHQSATQHTKSTQKNAWFADCLHYQIKKSDKVTRAGCAKSAKWNFGSRKKMLLLRWWLKERQWNLAKLICSSTCVARARVCVCECERACVCECERALAPRCFICKCCWIVSWNIFIKPAHMHVII